MPKPLCDWPEQTPYRIHSEDIHSLIDVPRRDAKAPMNSASFSAPLKRNCVVIACSDSSHASVTFQPS